jgi:hypothetical protein
MIEQPDQPLHNIIVELVSTISNIEIPDSIRLLAIQTLNDWIDSNSRARYILRSNLPLMTGLIQHIDNYFSTSNNFDVNLSQENCAIFLQHWHHMICFILMEKIGEAPIPPLSSDFIIRQCIWGCYYGLKEHCKESIQFLYVCSQSRCALYQDTFTSMCDQIINVFIYCLRNRDDVVKYMVLCTLIEWVDEAADHLIVTKSVKDIVRKFLQQNLLLREVLPLLGVNCHPLVKRAALNIFTTMLSVISSTTGVDMDYFAKYLSDNVLLPFVKSTEPYMSETQRIECLKMLISEKRIIPTLINVGALPMIEKYHKQLPFVDLKMLRNIDIENKSVGNLLKSIQENSGIGIEASILDSIQDKNA